MSATKRRPGCAYNAYLWIVVGLGAEEAAGPVVLALAVKESKQRTQRRLVRGLSRVKKK